MLTTQQYDLRPQSVSDLTNEVDGKYIISVVELQQEGDYYSLSKDDLTAITTYIAETAAAFAPEAVLPPQSTFKKAGTKKIHSNTCASVSTLEVEGNPKTSMPTTSSGRGCKRRTIMGKARRQSGIESARQEYGIDIHVFSRKIHGY